MAKDKYFSILQENTNECFFCKDGDNYNLDWHHVFNGANKKKSEKYGLMVRLHHMKCHMYGKNAVHDNYEVNLKLKQLGQAALMEKEGLSTEEFIKMFGKNYL